MKTVTLRVGDDGSIWVTSECRQCGHVFDCRAAQALLAPVICQKCHRTMDIRGAIITAAQRPATADESSPEDTAGLADSEAKPL
jgi:hypothetical protein